MRFYCPIKTVSEANERGHWSKKAKRAASQRHAIALAARAHIVRSDVPAQCVVTLTRIAPRKLDDDNLRGAMKFLRDGLADFLGIDDRHSEQVRYEYVQTKGQPKEYGVEVRFSPMTSEGDR